MPHPLPRIERLADGAYQFVLDDKPFLILGGELNNSSFSNVVYMREQTEKLKAANLNTILGSISWEQIEREEGRFEFAELDRCIEWAREAGLRVILLWFGAYKNGMSVYTPSWVKLDTKRFPRVRIIDKTPFNLSAPKTRIHDVVSLFGDRNELLEADKRAFTALMSHIKDFDGEHQTVIMVQVENESGIMGDSRDRSACANAVFDRPPPADLVTFLHDNAFKLSRVLTNIVKLPPRPAGSWTDTFGASRRTDELFMAYHYARYHDAIAAAGKSVYDIPYYTNVAITTDNAMADRTAAEEESMVAKLDDDSTVRVDGGDAPGFYPSGGAVVHMLPIWRHFSPHLALLAPDIYVEHYPNVCAEYSLQAEQPLFIPEQRRTERSAFMSWEAIGTYGALGVSPFGIDTTVPGENVYGPHYALMEKAAPWLFKARQDGRPLIGFHFEQYKTGEEDPSPKREIFMGDWKVTVARSGGFGEPTPGYGMVIQLEHDRFMLVGEGFSCMFASTNPSAAFNGLLRFDEIDIELTANGEPDIVQRRLLNGDETAEVGHTVAARMPWHTIDFEAFFVAINIPSWTKLAIAQPYWLEDDSE